MVNLWGPGAFGAARSAAARPTFTPQNGAGDPDDWAKDCSSPTARDGTEWTSALLNMLLAQLRGVVRKSSVAPTNLDDDLLAKAIASGYSNWVVATGTANAWVLAPGLAVPTYAAGRVLWVKAPATNTAIAVTVDVSGLGARSLKKRGGGDPAIGDLVGGTIYPIIDDGTNLRVAAPLSSDLAAPAQLQPIFPEVLTGANALTATASTGQIVIDPAQTWQHRGLISFSSDSFSAPDRTFATAANKVYHLVWDAPGTGVALPASAYPFGRFVLTDRTAASPVETDKSYDSTYDRMLCARVVTNGANTPTVTPLKNKVVLASTHNWDTYATQTSGFGGLPTQSITLNWARSPQTQFAKIDLDVTLGTEALMQFSAPCTRYGGSSWAYGYALVSSTNTYIAGYHIVEARA